MTTRALVFRVVHVPGDGHERCTLTELRAALGDPYGERVQRAIDKHQPRGLLRHGGQVWVTRWHCRWAITWIASVDRVAPDELRALLERVGLAGTAP